MAGGASQGHISLVGGATCTGSVMGDVIMVILAGTVNIQVILVATVAEIMPIVSGKRADCAAQNTAVDFTSDQK